MANTITRTKLLIGEEAQIEIIGAITHMRGQERAEGEALVQKMANTITRTKPLPGKEV